MSVHPSDVYLFNDRAVGRSVKRAYVLVTSLAFIVDLIDLLSYEEAGNIAFEAGEIGKLCQGAMSLIRLRK